MPTPIPNAWPPAELEVLRLDEPEQQGEAGHVQADDDEREARRAAPLGRRQGRPDALPAAHDRHPAHRPTIGKWVKPRAVAELSLDHAAHALEPRRLDRLERAAALAGHEPAVAGDHPRVEPGTVAEVDVAHEPELLEHVQVAVHGRDVEPAEPLGEHLGARGGGRVVERLQHQATGGRDAQAAGPQGADR